MGRNTVLRAIGAGVLVVAGCLPLRSAGWTPREERVDLERAALDLEAQRAGLDGTDYQVEAIALAADGKVYVGGGFYKAGSSVVNYVAVYDGEGWHPLGSGVNNWVWDVAVHESNVYVAGLFTKASGVDVSYVAKWDGAQWSSLNGGTDNRVYSVAVDDAGTLYAAGTFTEAGGVAANGIAAWYDDDWHSLGSGLGSADGGVGMGDALLFHGGSLYVGGAFGSAGGVTANNVARWDGSAWHALGSGLDDYVQAIACSDAFIYAGGWFESVSGDPAFKYLARWTGAAWEGLENPLPGYVNGLAVRDDRLYVACPDASWLGIWDESDQEWSSGGAVGGNSGGSPYAVATNSSGVYVGGDFTVLGGVSALRIGRWNGETRWRSMDGGVGEGTLITQVEPSPTGYYVTGWFTDIGGVPARNAAHWNGTDWEPLGDGMPAGAGMALVASGTTLHANAGRAIYRWDGAWQQVAKGLSDGGIYDLLVSGDIYAAGTFNSAGTTRLDGIGRWDGEKWQPLGKPRSNTDNTYHALLPYGGGIVVGYGGWYPAEDVGPFKRIARWSGGSWSGMGEGFEDGDVKSLAVSASGKLYAAGDFSKLADGTPMPHIAVWNGSSWGDVGGGLDTNSGMAEWPMTTFGETLYVGGGVTKAGGTYVNGVACWNGAEWSSLGLGVGGTVTEWSRRVLDIATSPDGAEVVLVGYLRTLGGPKGFPAKFVGMYCEGSDFQALKTAGPVRNLNTGESYETIQAAVSDGATLAGHTVEISAGNYLENVTLGKALTVRGVGGGAVVTVRAADRGVPVFHITAAGAALQDLVVSGADGENGAGIRFEADAGGGTDLALERVVVSDCTWGMELVSEGAAVAVGESQLTLNGDAGRGVGGGIHAVLAPGSLSLQECTVSGNAGPGVTLPGGDVTVDGTVFSGNSGHGVETVKGDVFFGGNRSEVLDSGGWGVTATEGMVSISEGALDGVYRNAGGGVLAGEDLVVPAGFEAIGNGGPGLACVGPSLIEQGAKPDLTISLDSVVLRDNAGDGVFVGIANLHVAGSGGVFVDNGGHGLCVDSHGEIRVEGTGHQVSGNAGWGLHAPLHAVTIAEGALSSANSNGQGGILAGENLVVPVGFEAVGNGGPGLACVGQTGVIPEGLPDVTVVLDSVRVRDNGGVGIGVATGNVRLIGSGCEIVNNRGTGVAVEMNGEIRVEGTGHRVSENDGWGLHAPLHAVTVLEGALSSVNHNGGGGILAGNGLELPPGFEVIGNGGPGLACVGQTGVVPDELPDVTVVLDSVRVRDNGHDGVGIGIGNLHLIGSGCEIVGNAGHGVVVQAQGEIRITGGGHLVQGNGGWGLRAPIHPVTVADGALTSVNGNGEGGILAGADLDLPAGFEVVGNGGPGLACVGESGLAGDEMPGLTVTLESVRIRDNSGDGLGAAVANLHLIGTGIDIGGNGGHGVVVLTRWTISVSGSGHQIHHNSGWGLRASDGEVEIAAGAMTQVNGNGQGGVLGMRGVSLPSGFAVVYNGGPGIVCSGQTFWAEKIDVRSNRGHGIHVLNADLQLGGSGTRNRITWNSGWGIRVEGGNVTLTNTIVAQNRLGGIWVSGSDGGRAPAVDVSWTTVAGNGGDGLLLDTGVGGTVGNSRINGNLGYGLRSTDPGVTIVAQGNWWGSVEGPGASENPVSGNVDTANWSTTPPIGELSPGPDLDVPIGGSRVLRASLTNHSDQDEVYTVGVNDLLGWPLDRNELSVEAASGATVEVEFRIHVPEDTEPATVNQVLLAAAPDRDPGDMATGTIAAAARHGTNVWLFPGWNLVSVTVDTELTLAEILAETTGARDADPGMDPSVWSFSGTGYVRAALSGPLGPKVGYWVYLGEGDPLELVLFGTRPGSEDCLLLPGWNLIGPPADVVRPEASFLAPPVFGWNGTSYYNVSAETLGGNRLLRGQGYWLYSTSSEEQPLGFEHAPEP
jgi:hypothetical protein